MANLTREPNRFPTLAESVADWMGEEVLSGRWEPGRRITEVEVAEQVNVSRQPVREALRLLSDQGLIRITPRIGAVVADYNPKIIEQTYQVRAQLEYWLTSLAVPLLPPDFLEALAGRVEAWIQNASATGDLIDQYERAWMIRRDVMAFAGNEVALGLVVDLRSRQRGFPKVLRRDPEHLQIAKSMLRQLVDTCRAGDAEGAASAIEQYLLGNIHLVERAFSVSPVTRTFS